MTLLQRRDGDNHASGASYLEMVEFIIQNGVPSKVARDLEELWRRIVFFIAVSNSDDINPNELASGLSLNISQENNALDFDLAESVAADFRVSPKRAKKILAVIKTRVGGWSAIADQYGLSRIEKQRVEKAFRY